MLFELKIEGNYKADLREKELLFFWFLHCWISLMLWYLCALSCFCSEVFTVSYLYFLINSPPRHPNRPGAESKRRRKMPPPVDALHSTCKCYFVTWAHSGFCFFNPLTFMSDQDRISPYNINTISTRYVIRIEKNINLEIIGWSNTKFSELTL